MEQAVRQQSSFSRSMANEEKLGAYYTDLNMCHRIRNLFLFKEEKEYTVLEPAIGDASAIKAVTGKVNGFGENVKLFGVELNPNVCAEQENNPDIDYLINADFINDVIISNNAFSFVFTNPPYGVDENNVRLEQLFVVKSAQYLRSGGILCAVLPSYVVADERFAKQYLSRYTHIAHYKFDDEVYARFKQVVIIGRKKNGFTGLKEEIFEKFISEVGNIDNYPYLPTAVVDEPVTIPSLSEERVEEFTRKCFDADSVYAKMRNISPLYSSKEIGAKAAVQDYAATDLGEPILPLSPSMSYLIASTGGGAGMCGTEGTLHLQRGNAKIVKDTTERCNPETGAVEIVETSHTKMSLKIVENDGTITSF